MIEIFNVISHDTEKTLVKVSFEYGHNVHFILSQVKFSSQTLGKRNIPKKASERRKI